jgi:hypothetical protein
LRQTRAGIEKAGRRVFEGMPSYDFAEFSRWIWRAIAARFGFRQATARKQQKSDKTKRKTMKKQQTKTKRQAPRGVLREKHKESL